MRFPRNCAEADGGTVGKRETNTAPGVTEHKVEIKPVSTNELMVSGDQPAQVCKQGSECLHVPRLGALEGKGKSGRSKACCLLVGEEDTKVPVSRIPGTDRGRKGSF